MSLPWKSALERCSTQIGPGLKNIKLSEKAFRKWYSLFAGSVNEEKKFCNINCRLKSFKTFCSLFLSIRSNKLGCFFHGENLHSKLTLATEARAGQFFPPD